MPSVGLAVRQSELAHGRSCDATAKAHHVRIVATVRLGEKVVGALPKSAQARSRRIPISTDAQDARQIGPSSEGEGAQGTSGQQGVANQTSGPAGGGGDATRPEAANG